MLRVRVTCSNYLCFNFEKFTPGLTKKIWVKIVFPHLRAKIWENLATISCSFAFSLSRPSFFLPLLNNKVGTTDFFTSTLPLFQMIRSFPYRISSSRFVLWLFTATVLDAFTEMSEVNHPSFPGCLVCLIFSNYCFVIRKNFYYLLPITYYVSLSLIPASCLQFCVSLSGYI